MAFDFLQPAYHFFVDPLCNAPWRDGSGFWLRQILDDRYTVTLFFPFLPLLLLCPPRYLRAGIIATGFAFLVFAFGAPYALFWALNCAFFYWFAEFYAAALFRARETQSAAHISPANAGRAPDPARWAHITAVAVVVGWYLLTMAMSRIEMPAGWDAWLFTHARWCYPFHLGAEAGKLDATGIPEVVTTDGMGLFRLTFWNPHNIGTAYLVWRMTHYLYEINAGGIPRARRTLLNFYAYLCYAPNLIQGPIERFNDFQQQMDICHSQRRSRDVPLALARIGWGVAKSLLTTLYFIPALRDRVGYGLGSGMRYFNAPQTVENYWLVYFGVFLIIYALYLEFSGYCDISAGIARLLGYRQIENFNWCWFSTSLRDFWRRWHISLSALLRDYVYIPLGGNRNRPTFNLIATFAICGVWHIPNGYMAAWGIVMGAMLAINQWWVGWMKRLDAAPTGTLAALRRAVRRAHPLGPIVSWLFTMHCFVFSLLIFFGGRGGWRVVWEIIRRPLLALTGADVFAAPQ